ncbi:hemicentin-2 isoform X2 [Rhipicephalus microplus]|uniref:hemicentin-2 isoform X1 n=1 Tax=Rhipicephalus microplus TaxID=6941 RepID=UPI003F6A92B8
MRASRTLFALLLWTLFVACRGTPVRYDDQDGIPVSEEDEADAPAYVGQEGGQVELPCNVLHARDAATQASPVRVEWHRRDDADTEPVYAVYFSGRANLMQGRHQPRKDWSPRAYFAVLGSPAALKIKALGLADAGVYTCRVTRSDGSIQASIVRLSVLGPLEPPVIRDESGNIVSETAGPYMEGDVATLVCQVKAAGRPAPQVRWLRRPRRPLSDDDEEPVPGSAVTTVSSALDDASVQVLSKLRQGPLSRTDLLIQLVCEVDNGLAAPVRTTVRLDMLLAPLTVRILRASGGALTAGLPVELVCEARGSRPPAQLTWWKRGVQLSQSFGHASADGNVSTSVVSFTPSADDHGQELRCVARNPALPPSAPAPFDKWAMNVFYKPNVTLRLGQPFRDLEIMEGGDVYLECHVNANPPSSEVHWSKDGVEDFATKTLNGSTLPDVIISGRFLALQKARRNFSGRYACSATNSEGSALSNSLRLKVLHSPTCVEGAPIVYSASRHEAVRVTCRVAASPKSVRFRWSFSSSTRRTELTDFVVLGPEMEPDGTPVLDGDSPTVVSVLEYTPQFQSDFGTLHCSASNSMGDQREPCTFHVVQAGPPEPLQNCSITNLTERSFSVECREVRSSSTPVVDGQPPEPAEGSSGGASLVAAVQRPSLLARPAENLVYVLEVYGPPEGSSTQRGVSASQHQVLVRNVSGPEPRFRVGQLWPGTEFEARVFAANSKGRSRPFRLNACTLPPAEALLDKVPTWTLGFSILHWLLLVLFLILIIVAIILLVWFRRRMQRSTTEGTNKPSTESEEPWCGQMAQTMPVSRSRSSIIATKDEIIVLDKRKDTVDV